MKRDAFRVVMSLMRNQPWLQEKTDLIDHLLFEDCNDEESRELLIDLVNRFEFVDNTRYQFLMRQIALEIVTEPEIHEQTTLIAAMSVGSGADSGQSTIYSLKPLLQEHSWTRHKIINDALHSYKTIKSNAPLKDIILVDEFVGSGRTVIGRVDTIKRQFSENGITDYSIRVKVLASTKTGLNNVIEHGIKISSQITLAKGISEYFNESLVEKNLALMEKLEGILSTDFNGREMPSLGFGKAESLYFRINTNLPNSVFPIFWWAEYKNKKTRKTLLTRAMGDA